MEDLNCVVVIHLKLKRKIINLYKVMNISMEKKILLRKFQGSIELEKQLMTL